MTQEEKDLLLKDLTARLRYRVCAKQYYSVSEDDFLIEGIIGEQIYAAYNAYYSMTYLVEKIKPYLRPLSSMTEEEENEYHNLCKHELEVIPDIEDRYIYTYYDTVESIDWLNKKQFDYRGLIPMSLALQAPDGMYKTN